MEKILITAGRVLLGIYFLLPGISKIPTYAGTTEYMLLHNVPLTGVLLPLTIVLQIVFGVMLIIGYRIRESALILAVLTTLSWFYILKINDKTEWNYNLIIFSSLFC